MSSRTEQRTRILTRLERALRSFGEQDVLHGHAAAARLGVNPTDHGCVSLLEAEGPMTAGALAERAGLTSGAITGVLDRLEKAGFARRRRDPADRRQVIVEVSKERSAELEHLLRPLAPSMEKLSEPFTDAQLSLLVDFLEKARDQLRAQTTRLRDQGRAPDELSAPLGNLQRCKLRFASGSSRVELRGDAPAGNLYRAHFEGKPPEIHLRGGALVVRYPRFSLLDWRRSDARISISGEIPWEVEFGGGTSRLRAELSGVDLRGLTITGGASDVEVDLPRPRAVVHVRLTGGASNVTLRRPADVAVQLRLLGGASRLALDAQQLGSAGGRVVLQTPGFEHAAHRYEVELTGGASNLTVGAAGDRH